MSSGGRWAAGLVAALVVCGAGERDSFAGAKFMINNLDLPGTGFNDARSVAPVGGNPAGTLGEQRMNVFRKAAEIWGRVLDSPVPIAVDARFGPLSCSGDQIVLGRARANSAIAEVTGLIPGLAYPIALANAIAGEDLQPSLADIDATFNGDLLGCSGDTDWYYGFDGKAGSNIDLLSVVLHEMGHGLGFAALVDLESGAPLTSRIDVFSTHILDLTTGQHWDEMSNAQRAASAMNVRHLVWDGPHVTAVAARLLARGAPVLSATPEVPGLTGYLSEASFGVLVSTAPVTGSLMVGSPQNGCQVSMAMTNAVALFFGTAACNPLQPPVLAETAGARAVLMADSLATSPPSTIETQPENRAQYPVNIPVVGITVEDAQLLVAAAQARPTTISLTSDDTRMVGADAQGRVYLYASDPLMPSSSVSHWDPLVRPNPTEEPESSFDTTHEVTLEAALLHDLGWPTLCGNGQTEQPEECDDGTENSPAGPCRLDCTRLGGSGGSGGTDGGAGGGGGTGGGGTGGGGTGGGSGGAGGSTTGGAGGSTGGSGGSVASDAGPDGPSVAGDDGGCGCDLGARSPAGGAAAVLVGLALLFARRRTRWSR